MPRMSKIQFDIELLEKRIKNTDVDTKLFLLLNSKEIVSYFFTRLVSKVTCLIQSLPSVEEKSIFEDAINRNYLWDELRKRVLTKLFENSVEIWLKLKDGDLLIVMYKFLDESVIRTSIDEMAEWVQTIYDKMTSQ